MWARFQYLTKQKGEGEEKRRSILGIIIIIIIIFCGYGQINKLKNTHVYMLSRWFEPSTSWYTWELRTYI